MSDHVITLEPQNLAGTTVAPAVPPPRGHRADAMKFVHASGTKPLDGYTIKRGIGTGGFGEVYFALSDAGKEVALKRIQRHLDVELRGVSQCLNLKHPNLVSLYDIKYDDQGEAWVVMEFVAGESLREALERNPTGMSSADVAHWFTGIGEGVVYLHDHGIVHRDLKPGNIFSDQGFVKIGDYGLSKFISCSRRSGHTESVGTFHYMAPEIGRGSYGKEIDVYALGIILYEMLTGHVPFDGESSQEIIMKHLTDAPNLTKVPPAFHGIVSRALAKDPIARYASVAEMLTAVRMALNGVAPEASVAKHANSEVVDAVAVPETAAPHPHYKGNGSPNGKQNGAARQRPNQPQTSAPQYAAASASPSPAIADEPIAKMIEHWVRGVSNWWSDPKVDIVTKIVLTSVVSIVVLINSGWLIALAIPLGTLYLIYFGVRALVISLSAPSVSPPPARPQPQPPVAQQPATNQLQPVFSATPVTESPFAPAVSPFAPLPNSTPSVRHRRTLDAARDLLSRRTLAEQCLEFVGAMLLSTLVVAVLGVLMLVVDGKPLSFSLNTGTLYGWFVLSGTAAAWSVLGLGRLWELRAEDAMRRRFIMLVAGMVLGGVTFGLHEFLTVGTNDSLAARPYAPVHLPSNWFDAKGNPLIATYIIYFAAVFGGLRWWKQADPLRPNRLSLWDSAVCVAFAWLVQQFCVLEQPWPMMLVGTVSVAVQLAAPWLSNQQRTQLRNTV